MNSQSRHFLGFENDDRRDLLALHHKINNKPTKIQLGTYCYFETWPWVQLASSKAVEGDARPFLH